MSILLINQYYWPDVAATGQLLADLAEDLAASGHEVSVLTGRGRYAIDRSVPLERRERRRGVEVRRLWCTDFGRGNILGRVSDYLSFLVTAALAIAISRRNDIVVCLSTPPLLAAVGIIAKARGALFVYKVEDLYPEVAIALGALRENSLQARALSRLSAAVLARADTVVALDGAMSRKLRQRGAGRVEVIPNWTDGSAITPDSSAGETFREKHGLGGRFIVLYSGNMGRAHRFGAVVAAANQLATSNPEILFLFVGAGARAGEVRSATEFLTNVRFLPYQKREDLPSLFNAADIHLVTLRDEVAGLLVPSKYSSALAAGKPVLLVGGAGADLHQEITERGVGWVCRHDSGVIRDTIADSARDSADTAERGRQARCLFESKYDRALAVRRWVEVLT